MREKLIELLELALSSISWDWGDYPNTEEFADHLIANGVTISNLETVDKEWIPVTERLPEKEGTYLTYTEKERIHLDCFCIYPNHGTQFWIRGNGKVTHWMPLPEPPKGECE